MKLALSVFESIKSYLVENARDKSRYRSQSSMFDLVTLKSIAPIGMELRSGSVSMKPSLGLR